MRYGLIGLLVLGLFGGCREKKSMPRRLNTHSFFGVTMGQQETESIRPIRVYVVFGEARTIGARLTRAGKKATHMDFDHPMSDTAEVVIHYLDDDSVVRRSVRVGQCRELLERSSLTLEFMVNSIDATVNFSVKVHEYDEQGRYTGKYQRYHYSDSGEIIDIVDKR